MNLVSLIDHAILHPTATDEDLVRQCGVADELGVASVCVKPYMVARASELLAASKVAVGTVIGFPQGGNLTEVKVAEATLACLQGAVELDMVINIAKALEEDWGYITTDIKEVLNVAVQHNAILKVIFETDYITSESGNSARFALSSASDSSKRQQVSAIPSKRRETTTITAQP